MSKRCCKQCKEYFEEFIKVPAGVFCTEGHMFDWLKVKQDKATAKRLAKAEADTKKKDKAERADLRKRKAALLTASDWIKKVQPVFNKFIRLRDRDEDCISCGRSNAEVESSDGWKPGGAWDCGHYLTVGAFPELRFNPYVAHKQCKSCNAGSGKYTRKNHTVGKEYRIRLIKKIGLYRVEWLEGPHPPKKYTIDQLKELMTEFRKRIKLLEQRFN